MTIPAPFYAPPELHSTQKEILFLRSADRSFVEPIPQKKRAPENNSVRASNRVSMIAD